MRRAGDRVADPRRPPLSRNRGRAAGLCRARAVRWTIGKPFVRTSDCADTGMQMEGLPLAPRGRRRPGACGPNAEPPFVPESSVELPSRGESRRRRPLISHAARPGNAPRSRNDLAQSSEWRSRGPALGSPPRGGSGVPSAAASPPREAWQGPDDLGITPVRPRSCSQGNSRRLTAAARRRRLRADPRGAPPICGRSEPPSCSGAGLLCGWTAGVPAVSPSFPAQSSAETPKATAKPNVVTRPTALPPRR